MAPPLDPFVEMRGWQKRLLTRLRHLPWDDHVPWFLHPDPQVAWERCDDAMALLWVLGHTLSAFEYDAKRDLAGVLFDTLDIYHRGKPSSLVEDYGYALRDLFGDVRIKTAPVGLRRLDQKIEAEYPENNLVEIAGPTRNYLVARVLSDCYAVWSGAGKRAHYAGYYAKLLGVTNGELLDAVGRRFQMERFTR